MMKRSAGILPYKYIDNELYVYLEHPGGPFWEGVDKWSVVKGEYDNEKAINAARREFLEESGFDIKEDLEYLGSFKLKNKLVIMFCLEKDLDVTKMKSNTFIRDAKEYNEMDEARWFSIDEASLKVFNRQRKIIDRLKLIKERK
jgi:predicted NUDIX family NTP pyrophosphohydrolase